MMSLLLICMTPNTAQRDGLQCCVKYRNRGVSERFRRRSCAGWMVGAVGLEPATLCLEGRCSKMQSSILIKKQLNRHFQALKNSGQMLISTQFLEHLSESLRGESRRGWTRT